VAKARVERRRPGMPTATNEKSRKVPRASQPKCGACGGCRWAAAAAAVVVTVIVDVLDWGVPAAVTEAGANVQAAPVGSPEQASLMVPLNPVDDETETELCPDAPGAETCTKEKDWLEGMAAKNPGVIVNDTDWVVLLTLKLLSPP